MSPIRRLSIIDQTAEHLREGIRTGRWRERLPGVRPLSTELDVSRETLRSALRRLEAEGMVSGDGAYESRTITAVPGPARATSKSLRIAILIPAGIENESGTAQAIILRLVGELQGSGHVCTLVALPAGTDLHKTGRLATLVKATAADAWIVRGGTLEILEWFSEQPIPVIGLGGRSRTLPIASAGYDPSDAIRESTAKLVSLGHKRIVLVCPDISRNPSPSILVKTFQDELTAAGITVGEYNTPDWAETPEGFRSLLDSLFKITPPTALILWKNLYTTAALTYFAEKGIRVPQDVSLISMDKDVTIGWQYPGMKVAHYEDNRPLYIRRIVRWMADLVEGKQDKECRLAPAIFHPGNTLGPAPK